MAAMLDRKIRVNHRFVSMRPRSNTHLTRQIGEHLVVAELGRHGIIATPFAGNMPDYDVVALTPTGQSIYIQVKAMNSGDWQLDANRFLSIEYNKERNQQKNAGLRPTPAERVNDFETPGCMNLVSKNGCFSRGRSPVLVG
jgi:hypothetical protein